MGDMQKSQLYSQPAVKSCVIQMRPEKKQDAGLMSPISGIVLIMKNTRAVSVVDMDYKGIGVDRDRLSVINDRLSMTNY